MRRLEHELRRQTPSSTSPPSSNGSLNDPLVVSADVSEEEDGAEYDSDGEWHVLPRSLDVVDHGMFSHNTHGHEDLQKNV